MHLIWSASSLHTDFNPFIASYPCSAHTWVLPKHQRSDAQKQLRNSGITFSRLFMTIISQPHNQFSSFLSHFKEHWIQINCVEFTRPVMAWNSSLHLMKLQYCLSVMIQNKTKHNRLLQNKPVFWFIWVNTFTEFLSFLICAVGSKFFTCYIANSLKYSSDFILY